MGEKKVPLTESQRRWRKKEVRRIQREAYMTDGVELSYMQAMRIWEKQQEEADGAR